MAWAQLTCRCGVSAWSSSPSCHGSSSWHARKLRSLASAGGSASSDAIAPASEGLARADGTGLTLRGLLESLTPTFQAQYQRMSQGFVAAARSRQRELSQGGAPGASEAELKAAALRAAGQFAARFQEAELMPSLRAWDRLAVGAARDVNSRRRLLRADADDMGPVARSCVERGDSAALAEHLASTEVERCQELYDALQRQHRQECFAGYDPLQFRREGEEPTLRPRDVAVLSRRACDSYVEVAHPVLDPESAQALYDYFRVHFWEAGLMERSENPCNLGSFNASLPFRSFGRGVGQVMAPGSPPPALHRAVELMTAIAAELSSHGYPCRLVVPQSVKLGCYAPGPARYRPHLDNYGEGGDAGRRQVGNNREVTVLLYPNPPEWDAEADGGALRLLRDSPAAEAGRAASGAELRALPPAGGRCVVFTSRAVLHEVLPTRRLRFCLTL